MVRCSIVLPRPHGTGATALPVPPAPVARDSPTLTQCCCSRDLQVGRFCCQGDALALGGWDTGPLHPSWAQTLSLCRGPDAGGPRSPSHPARRGDQHRLGSRGRDGAPSARTEGRHSGTPGARGEPSQLQALRATRAASARGCHPACQAGRDCGQQSRLGTTARDSQDGLQDRGHHPCQAAGHQGPSTCCPAGAGGL